MKKFVKNVLAEELPFLLAAPALMWQIFFLYLPVMLLVGYSIFEKSTTWYFSITFKHYYQIFSAAHVSVMINSFFIEFMTTIIALVIAYPVAYYLAMHVPKRYRTFLLFTLILPSWTSLIMQIYAWFFLLNKNSFLSRFLYMTGILPESVSMLNNYFSIIIGMVAIYLPFMILPIFTVLEKMDKRLLEASADLGANKIQTFRYIVFPLSLPGVFTGIVLVFLPSFGEFAVPTLLGGGKQAFWGTIIAEKFLMSRDWQAGAALASVGVIVPFMILMVVFIVPRIVRLTQLFWEHWKDGYARF
jgi:spermidine/putrescine transport system permease protein